jgi:hypothetical protein
LAPGRRFVKRGAQSCIIPLHCGSTQ